MKLYSPIKFRNIELPNRIVMSPMCMYSATDGVPSDFHFVHYGSRAQGGAGLIMVEATGVVPEGRITQKCLGIWNDEQATELGKIVKFIHTNTSSKVGIQLAHAGRKASTWNNVQTSLEEGWETVAPSEIPYKEGERLPHALTLSEIKELVENFGKAAKRAIGAGFDVIEIHAAHGYLIHQFLSPLSNVRADEYGGSFENRVRLLLEIVARVNSELNSDKALFVRISADEYAENGWSLEQSIELSRLLKEKGVDLVDVSSGGNIHSQKIELMEGYQVPFAEAIKKRAEVPTGAVGLITTAEFAEEVLQEGKADLIFFGRELLRNPYFPVLNSFQNNEECAFPIQYLRAKP